jgi:hypothetical protein
MSEILQVLAIFAVYFIVMRWLLPRLGVPT